MFQTVERKARDHPRMCGEHLGLAIGLQPRLGSSPHVRGTRGRWFAFWRSCGIIPACAGNTAVLTDSCFSKRDHPRMCGEHPADHSETIEDLGSSPHVRGTLVEGGRPVGQQGIIPACAGNTRRPSTLCLATWDHPRMCGEHIGRYTSFIGQPGSSPHVRGTHEMLDGADRNAGIIPACAGNTLGTLILCRLCGDHPRMCGEHLDKDFKPTYLSGSSPHVRGTRNDAGHRAFIRGIIPACAGNTNH